jgi:hypothetical protein
MYIFRKRFCLSFFPFSKDRQFDHLGFIFCLVTEPFGGLRGTHQPEKATTRNPLYRDTGWSKEDRLSAKAGIEKRSTFSQRQGGKRRQLS